MVLEKRNMLLLCRKGIFVQASPAAPCQRAGSWWETQFALEPVPGRSMGTLLPVPLEKTWLVLMLLLLGHSFKAPGRSLHTHPLCTPCRQPATACCSAQMG